MRNGKIINPEIMYALTKLGHTQSIVICDAGLPIPKGAKVIDLAFVLGEMPFLRVLEVVLDEGIFEGCIYAEEIKTQNVAVFEQMKQMIGDIETGLLSHEDFKVATESAEIFIRTGEDTPYANVILKGGVAF